MEIFKTAEERTIGLPLWTQDILCAKRVTGVKSDESFVAEEAPLRL